MKKILPQLFLAGALLMPPLAAKEFTADNGVFNANGVYGVRKELADTGSLTKANAAWSFNFWVNPDAPVADKTLLAGFGDTGNRKGEQRFLAVFDGKVRFWGASVDVSTDAALTVSRWQMLTATYADGELKIYLDGKLLKTARETLADAKPEINLAPRSPWSDGGHLGGRVALFTLWDKALTVEEIQTLSNSGGNFDALTYVKGAPKSWNPKGNPNAFGMRERQRDEIMPRGNGAASSPSTPKPPTRDTLTVNNDGSWQLAGPWKLAAAPKADADGQSISKPGFNDRDWYAATVPGTVLTTLVDQGVYPDPLFGLNNLAIPEELNKQDYWYRLEFAAPKELAGRRATLTFNGINYAAEAWLNGKRLGDVKGAFIRGVFDVTASLSAGKNALAVKVSPPPHPGIPHEQSVAAGAGPNGGAMVQDGPTFFCSEGWDWIPGIRDRNTGIWQSVELRGSDAATVSDPHVITRVAADLASASVSIEVPLKNAASQPLDVMLAAEFDQVRVEKTVTVSGGAETLVKLEPREFPALTVKNPRLWWPNGYGKPELYNLTLTVSVGGKVSDVRKLRFGIREVSLKLTAMDQAEQTGRYLFYPAAARDAEVFKHGHESLVDSPQGWVPTVSGEVAKLPGLTVSDSTDTSRYLELRVNGVRVPMRGGNWGMDDALKRVSRERLEPYIRLQRDSNFNTLRNWCGQSTEEALFDLCDEYGIMVFNEFWLTTQWSNLEPADADLLLANAADSVRRFRHHPSIVIWCGRNEGVPPPAVNSGLDKIVRELDGTRYYQPDSITINLDGSGPWKYLPLADYFGKKGFTTELGLPSPLTLDGLKAFLPAADLWPPNDVWAYHDWVPSGAMDVKTFMAALTGEYGEPADAGDFARKAAMVSYTAHRAMYEGFGANLWQPNTGRFLWMSHSSWPSMVWQIYGHDYEATPAFYGVKKACEPVHAQLNLPDYTAQITNTTRDELRNVKLTAKVFAADGQLVSSNDVTVSVPANSIATAFTVGDNTALNFVKLELRAANGTLLSENFYWRAPQPEGLLALNDLPKVKLTAKAAAARDDKKVTVSVTLQNPAKTVALMTHLTLRNTKDRTRVLPAYYSDNYVTLLSGEQRTLTVETPAPAAPLQLTLDGWNIEPVTVSVD